MRFRLPEAEVVGPYSPLIASDLVRQRLRRRSMAHTSNGLEMRCGRCGDFWPFDTQFFYATGHADGGLHRWCRSCCALDIFSRLTPRKSRHAAVGVTP